MKKDKTERLSLNLVKKLEFVEEDKWIELLFNGSEIAIGVIAGISTTDMWI